MNLLEVSSMGESGLDSEDTRGREIKHIWADFRIRVIWVYITHANHRTSLTLLTSFLNWTTGF